MAPDKSATPSTDAEPNATEASETEHFRPVGTMFLLACFVVALVLMWVSVYLILLDRGVTV